MKTVEKTIEVSPDEKVVTMSECACKKNDTRTVVIAVGGAVVLFIIGLILGYLLGHNAANRSNYGPMMQGSGSYGRFDDQGTMPMRRYSQNGTTQQGTTNTNPQTPTQAQ